METQPAPSSEASAPVVRAGMVAVVGRANVGKSTLVNRILGEKVSIVSPVAQTTRNLIRGVLTEPRGQLVFLDTPGVHKSSTDLGKAMNRLARGSVEGVDVAALVLDASVPPRQEDEGWMRRLMREPVPCFSILNKSDKGAPYAEAHRAAWTRAAAERSPAREAEWFSVSAKRGEGTEDLVAAFFRAIPPGPYLFPAEVLTDFPRKIAVSDIIREKLLRRLHEELPHSIAVFVDTIEEEGDRWDVHATIYVQRHSQKGIVIGNKGRLVRATRRASEKELAALYDRNVSVRLWVKVEKDWPRNFWFLKKLGYVD